MVNRVEAGVVAPDFTLPGTDGAFSLSQWRGKNLLLYFYPRDNTPGCTRQAEDFAAAHAELLQLDCAVFGISRDTLQAHERFRAKLKLPFHLLSDAEERVCVEYGVIRLRKLYGKQVRGIERSTFLIDGRGTVVRAWRGVIVKDHVDAVLAAVRTQ